MDAFVAQHLQGVSRTYALLIPLLPPPLADAVGVAYLLMRIVDTIEDAPELDAAGRVRRLRLVDAALDGDEQAAQALAEPLGATEAERVLMRAAPQVFERIAALEPGYRVALAHCARAMSAGVAGLLERSAERDLPYPAVLDETELRAYCHYVAGTVGEMLCTMMSAYLGRPSLLELRALAVELGIGLQLVNILKDAWADARHSRRYLPRVAGGLSHTEIYAAAMRQARTSLLRGVDFVLALPSAALELRLFCGLPIAWGALTLASRDAAGRVGKIGRDAIRVSTEAFRRQAGDDAALRQWLAGLLGGEAAEAGSRWASSV